MRVEPLDLVRTQELFEAGKEEEIWQHMPWAAPRVVADMERLIEGRLEAGKLRGDVSFQVIQLTTDTAVGMTSFLDVDRGNRRVEIGATWLGAGARRTSANTETKFLLLRHLFEELEALRVQFKTDARNVRSQRALERIGAVREGILRRHMLMPDGYVRDSVYYGIVDSEWNDVRRHLTRLLERAS